MDINLIQKVLTFCTYNETKLRFAESCTGGGLAYTATNMPGSSKVIDVSLVTYSAEVKMKLLHVPEKYLTDDTIVSKGCAQHMNMGLQLYCKSHKFSTNAIYVTVTGWLESSDSKYESHAYYTIGKGEYMMTYRKNLDKTINRPGQKAELINSIYSEIWNLCEIAGGNLNEIDSKTDPKTESKN